MTLKSDGKNLIRKFCIPKSPTKKNPVLRNHMRLDDPDARAFVKYNLQDVVAERAVFNACKPMSSQERELWLLDQRINIRGIQIDIGNLDLLIEVIEKIRYQLNIELSKLTDGAVPTSDSVQVMAAWISKRLGYKIEGVNKDAVESLLTQDPPVPPDVRRVLRIRQLLGQSSVAKIYAIKHAVCADGRLRGLFRYYGASRTGRWTAQGPQPHNSPRDTVDDIEATLSCSADELSSRPDPLKIVSGCIRGLYCAAPGHELICSDYSAIEAVVLAELAGEKWRQNVFRSHGLIYETSASKITGVPLEEILEYQERTGTSHPLRKGIGKVAELASGYGGWIAAWLQFGADKYFNNEYEIKKAILKWRAESLAIVEMWGGQIRQLSGYGDFKYEFYGLEGAAVQAILHPGETFEYRGIRYYMSDGALRCRLLSGRELVYRDAELTRIEDRYSKLPIWQISYMGMGSNPKSWRRLYTYGGKLTGNTVQSTARDLLGHGMLAAERAKYHIVLHVHDEPVAEVPLGFGSIEEFERLISSVPDWAAGWPVRASGGWRGQRYRKG